MWDAIVLFFSQPPPALDPTFIPWLTALIAGNVIVFSAVWALLKYVAKTTPWAGDDKILQIITGAFGAFMGVLRPGAAVERVCDHEDCDHVECDHADCDHVVGEVCPTCGHHIE